MYKFGGVTMLLTVQQDKLIKKRKSLNMSQYRLSLLSGLSGNSVFRMENQDHRVSPLRAKAVADALQCQIDELFYVSE